MNIKIILLLFTALSVMFCGSTQIKDEKKEIPENILKFYEGFFGEPVDEEKAFRVFCSSGYYERRQLNSFEILEIKNDAEGDHLAAEDLKEYDKVDFFGKAVVKIELYPDTGTLSRVRFLRSSGISELDRIISEDITRWKFSFLIENKEDDEIPEQFLVEYAVLLEKKISRDEAVEELKKYVR
ncbi:MAG: energy transducer TonB [Spirochaetia bacterium]|nr:energy transducer TonB [Spirochaetia bacterium]